MQNYFVLSRFFYSSYKPFGYNLVLFRKKKKQQQQLLLLLLLSLFGLAINYFKILVLLCAFDHIFIAC